MMKKSSVIFLGLIVSFLSCKTLTEYNVRIPSAEKQEVEISEKKNIFITDFHIKDPEKIGFDLNEKIKNFFSSGFKPTFEAVIFSSSIPFEENNIFENKNFWKTSVPDKKEESLFITGTSSFASEIRKSLRDTRGGRFEDPFEPEKRLAVRKFYSLTLEVYYIQGETGEVVFQKKFEESKGYSNPNQTAEFAFYDLVQQVKQKMIPYLTGRGKLQERRLLIK